MLREMGSLLNERAEKAMVSKADMPLGLVRVAGALFLRGFDKHFLGFQFLLPLGLFLSHLYSDARSKFQKLQICIFLSKLSLNLGGPETRAIHYVLLGCVS